LEIQIIDGIPILIESEKEGYADEISPRIGVHGGGASQSQPKYKDKKQLSDCIRNDPAMKNNHQMYQFKNNSKLTACYISTVHVHPFASRMFYKISLSLVKAGYQVHIIACHNEDEIKKDVNIHALPKPPNRLVRIIFWPWLAYRRILKIIPRPDICQFSDPELIFVGFLLYLKGFKVIFDVQENISVDILHKPYIPFFLRRIISLLYSFFEKVFTYPIASIHILENIAQKYRHPRVVVRNLPIITVASAKKKIFNTYPTKLIYVGSISQMRGAITMIQVAHVLNSREVNFKLRVIGPYETIMLEEKMRNLTSKMGLNNKIELVGPLPFQQAQYEISLSDIGLCLIHPLPNHLNSLSTKLFEYMQYGLPVVASNFECWREYIEKTGSGLQVNPLNVYEIADAIHWLITHPTKMRDMSLKGQKAVIEKYCWEKEEKKLLKFYQQLLLPGESDVSIRS
jgi:glycosyltransferase involved in cell wall biosynthesis